MSSPTPISSSKRFLVKLVLSAMFLALAMVLPLLTGQIPQIGEMLCPLHLPTLLCGFFCGPVYGFVVGAVTPLLRFLMFGMPPLIPKGVIYCFELATYGLVSGLLYRFLPRKKPYIYVSLLGAMLAGRIVYGVVKTIVLDMTGSSFTFAMFISSAFTTAIPGIILQIVLIPILVMVIEKAFPKLVEKTEAKIK